MHAPALTQRHRERETLRNRDKQADQQNRDRETERQNNGEIIEFNLILHFTLRQQ